MALTARWDPRAAAEAPRRAPKPRDDPPTEARSRRPATAPTVVIRGGAAAVRGARAAATATGLVVMVEETACMVFASIGAWGKPARACVSDAAARWLDTPEPGALCATGAALSGDARSADEIARNRPGIDESTRPDSTISSHEL